MTKLSKREFVLLVILFIAISGAAYYNFVLRPYYAASDEIDVQTAECQTAINDAIAKKTAIDLTDTKIKAIEDEMSNKLKNVLDSIDRPAIIVLLNKTLAPKATEIIYAFSPAYQELESNYITTVEISCKCTQGDFLGILADLRAAKPITRVLVSSIRVVDSTTDICDTTITLDVLTTSITPTNTDFTYE